MWGAAQDGQRGVSELAWLGRVAVAPGQQAGVRTSWKMASTFFSRARSTCSPSRSAVTSFSMASLAERLISAYTLSVGR